MSVPGGVQRVLVHEDEREGALEPRQLGHGGILERLARVSRQKRRDEVGVGGRGGSAGRLQRQFAGTVGLRRHPGSQVTGIGQVAVVSQSQHSVGSGPERGLGVLPHAGTGGAVAAVAHGQVPVQTLQRRLVEDLRHQAHVLVDHDVGAIADGHPGRLLAAVLEGVEPEVGQLGDSLAGCPHSEHAAGILGTFVVPGQIVIKTSVSALHSASVGAVTDSRKHRNRVTAGTPSDVP